MYLITNTTYVFLYNKHLDANKKFPMAQNIMWLIQTECHTIVKHIMMKYTMNNSIYRILGISYHLDVNPDRQKKERILRILWYQCHCWQQKGYWICQCFMLSAQKSWYTWNYTHFTIGIEILPVQANLKPHSFKFWCTKLLDSSVNE